MQTANEATHRLIIPNMPYHPDRLWEKNNAKTSAFGQVGVIAAGLIPFRNILKTNRYNTPLITEQGNVATVRCYDRALIPLRFLSPRKRITAFCSLAVKAYETYFETDGRPDIIYAQDLLYAGMMAKKLNASYGLPYRVTIRKPLRQKDVHDPYMRRSICEVLKGATCITFADAKVKSQFENEFGSLDTVRHADLTKAPGVS